MIKAAKTLFVGLFLFTAAMPGGWAQVFSFSVTATAGQTRVGYTAGQSYNFTFNLTGDFLSPDSTFDPAYTEWQDYGSTSTRLVRSIYGSLTNGGGDYSATTPRTWLDIFDETIELNVSGGVDGNIGLYTLGGQLITGIYLELPNDLYTPALVAITPGDYFAGYPATIFSSGLLQINSSGGSLSFNVTRAEIPAAVPEPSTWALVACGAVGCWLVLRRRASCLG